MKKLLTILFAVALGMNLSAQTNYADDWNPDADGDNSVGVSDLLALLSVFAENDADDDGIWDSQDDCVGVYDECGECNGLGPQILGIDTIIVYFDSLYAEAIDEWWVYEVGADTLLTYLCENPGCMNPTADNYDPYAIEDDNSCFWSSGTPECNYQNAITFDSYSYELVSIGEQCWFAENLLASIYANGDSILGDLTNEEWSSTVYGAMAVYGEGTATVWNGNEDEESNLAMYGRLYNWHAVNDNRGLCPTGWHVPSVQEMDLLNETLGGAPNAGISLKSSPLDTPPWDGSNTAEFSARPAGMKEEDGSYYWEGFTTTFWSASPTGYSGPVENTAFSRNIQSNFDGVSPGADWYNRGFSVRCLKDTEE